MWSKPPKSRERRIERAFAGVTERRMAEVVRQRQRLGQVLVEAERAGERAGDLSDFERMGQPGAVMVALVIDEDLGLVGEPAERGGMDDAVAIAAEGVAGGAWRLGDSAGRGCRAGSDGIRTARAMPASIAMTAWPPFRLTWQTAHLTILSGLQRCQRHNAADRNGSRRD